ncbi:MAG: DUF1559 domain-containing protein [Pirellulales bacterium]
MPNLFDDFQLPNAPSGLQPPAFGGSVPTPPDLKSTTFKTCGCLAIVGFVFATLFLAALTLGFFWFREHVNRREEAARIQAEQQAAMAAEQRANLERAQQERIAEQERLQAEAARLLAEQQARAKAEESRLKAELMQRQRQEQERIENEKRLVVERRDADHGQMAIATGLNAYLSSAVSEFFLPNGGEKGSGLSWRVHLLPYIGQKTLFDQFRLNEAWDSEHNRPLIKSMPKEFGSSPEGKTRFRTLLNVDGQGWPYLKSPQITDGTDQTIAIAYFGPNQAIEWTRPDDLDREVERGSILQLLDWLPSDNSTMNRSSLPDTRIFFERRRALLCNLSKVVWPAFGTDDQLKALATPSSLELINCSYNRDTEWLIIENVIRPNTDVASATLNVVDLKTAAANLEKLGKAIQDFQAAESRNPSLGMHGPLLSWRVHILPYLGAEDLFRKFNLNEPWNSPSNFALLPEIPPVFQLGASWSKTRIRIPVEPKSGLVGLPSLIRPFSDEKDSTMLTSWVAPHLAVPWTMHDALHLTDAKDFASNLGWGRSDPILIGTFSGESLILPAKLHQSKITAIVSRFGGEVFDLEAALAEPEKGLRLTQAIQPATPIVGLVQMPDVPPVELVSQPVASTTKDDEARLRKLSLALHNYEDASRKSPMLVINKLGHSSRLSWRVHLLPFLDQKNLYEKFALDEPWDSPTNLEAAAAMPAVYGDATDGKYLTDICTFVGKGTLLNSKSWMRQCTDSLNNTIMLIQVPRDRRVMWTKPEDVELNEEVKLSDFIGERKSILVAMGDGSVMPISSKVSNEIFRALITTAGNELVDGEAVKRLSLHSLNLPVTSQLQKRASESMRLKRIAMAMLNYQSSFKFYPPGRPKVNGRTPPESYCLSWRVHILPFLGYSALYNQFRLKEPWDSPHNKQLISLMPDIFRDEQDAVSSKTTRIQVFVGEGSPFQEIGEAPRQNELVDGASNTIMVLVAPSSKSVPWTMPADYEVDLASNDFQELRDSEGLAFATFDGAARRLPPDFDAEKLKAMITVQGGEVVDASQFQR